MNAWLHGRINGPSSQINRRTFLSGMGTFTALLSLTSHGAAAVVDGPREPIASATPVDPWHVDDMCGHWPRYAHPIPRVTAQSGAEGDAHPVDAIETTLAAADPIDHNFLMA